MPGMPFPNSPTVLFIIAFASLNCAFINSSLFASDTFFFSSSDRFRASNFLLISSTFLEFVHLGLRRLVLQGFSHLVHGLDLFFDDTVGAAPQPLTPQRTRNRLPDTSGFFTEISFGATNDMPPGRGNPILRSAAEPTPARRPSRID